MEVLFKFFILLVLSIDRIDWAKAQSRSKLIMSNMPSNAATNPNSSLKLIESAQRYDSRASATNYNEVIHRSVATRFRIVSIVRTA